MALRRSQIENIFFFGLLLGAAHFVFKERPRVMPRKQTPRRRRAPGTRMARAYAAIGASPTMTFNELRRCYRQAIFNAHPDHGGTDKQAIRVNLAWTAVQRDHRTRMGSPVST